MARARPRWVAGRREADKGEELVRPAGLCELADRPGKRQDASRSSSRRGRGPGVSGLDSRVSTGSSRGPTETKGRAPRDGKVDNAASHSVIIWHACIERLAIMHGEELRRAHLAQNKSADPRLKLLPRSSHWARDIRHPSTPQSLSLSLSLALSLSLSPLALPLAAWGDDLVDPHGPLALTPETDSRAPEAADTMASNERGR